MYKAQGVTKVDRFVRGICETETQGKGARRARLVCTKAPLSALVTTSGYFASHKVRLTRCDWDTTTVQEW